MLFSDMYKSNATMELIGKQQIADYDVSPIINGMKLPMTSENILLASNALAYGVILGKREKRSAGDNDQVQDLIDRINTIPSDRSDVIKHLTFLVQDVLNTL